jgi:hypothetical protein
MPSLQTIENVGTTVLEANDISQLSQIRNTKDAKLKIETTANLTKIATLDDAQGTLEIGANPPNVKNLNVTNGAKITALPTANFPNLTNIKIQKDAQFVAEKNSKFDVLKELTNDGTAIFNTQFLQLHYLQNSENAKLQLSEKTKVVDDIGRTKETILAKQKPILDALPWIDQICKASGIKYRDSFSEAAKIMEEEFRGDQLYAVDFLANAKKNVKSQSQVNYVLAKNPEELPILLNFLDDNMHCEYTAETLALQIEYFEMDDYITSLLIELKNIFAKASEYCGVLINRLLNSKKHLQCLKQNIHLADKDTMLKLLDNMENDKYCPEEHKPIIKELRALVRE